ncbi:hypothetical protein BSL78_00172 [Apostichopus japonicus]|uniref:Uncharacterized protein n=1 Tax=Stichopus japonicus TaxID=307972 RepID=A0A2G8LRN7_STIJA|nr:hypothetical protein BSL78_00172 [Apostichopus japonicus]
MARTYPFQEPATMKLLVFTLFCFMACALVVGLSTRLPEQCECSPCLPEIRCDGENVTDFNFIQSLSWVFIFAAVNTSIPELQQGTIALPNMPYLRHLELSSNGIHILTEQVSTTNYTRLSVMILSDNRLSVVPSPMMRLAPNLAYIDLSGNMITVIHSDVFTFNNDLNVILLADNGLQTIEEKAFAGVTELRTLNLSYNSIMGTNLGNWEEFHASIETVSLSGNGLRQMPTLNPNYKFSCKYLSLEHNHFEALDKFALAAFEN